MSRRRPHSQSEDSGAALILAIGFVLMVGAISAGLASLTTSSLNNRGTLEQVRDRQYAAEGAIQQAIAKVQSTGVTASECASSAVTQVTPIADLNGVTIRVDRTNACGVVRTAAGTVVAQRNVSFAACVQNLSPCTGAAVIVRAQVNFEQGSSGVVTNTYIQSWSVNR